MLIMLLRNCQKIDNLCGTVVPPNSRLIGSKKNRELGDLITVVNRSSQKLLLSKNIWANLGKFSRNRYGKTKKKIGN